FGPVPTTTTPQASFEILSRTPDALPAGYEVTHTPSSAGITETITVRGGDNPTVSATVVGGQPLTLPPLNANRQVPIDVATSTEVLIEVSYPQSPSATETFDLFFDYDKPLPTAPENKAINPATLNRYVHSSPSPPDDDRFKNSAAPSGNAALKGSATLTSWVQNRLTVPKQVRIEASASYESQPTPEALTEARNHNLDLSQRRFEVAKGI